MSVNAGAYVAATETAEDPSYGHFELNMHTNVHTAAKEWPR